MDDEVDKRDDREEQPSEDLDLYDNNDTWFAGPSDSPFEPIQFANFTQDYNKSIEKVLYDLDPSFTYKRFMHRRTREFVRENFKFLNNALYFEGEKVTSYRDGKYIFLQSFLRSKSRVDRFENTLKEIGKIENDERSSDSENFQNQRPEEEETPEEDDEEIPSENEKKVTLEDIEKILTDITSINFRGIKTQEAKNLIVDELGYKFENNGSISLVFEGERVTTYKDGKYQYLYSFTHQSHSRYIRFVNLLNQIDSLESSAVGEDLNSDTEDKNDDETLSLDSLNFDFRQEWLNDDDFRSEFFSLVGDQILNDRNSYKNNLDLDQDTLESLDPQIRRRIEEVFSDDIERHRKDLERSSDPEKETSRLIEILREYREDVEFFEKLIEENYEGEPIDWYRTALEIRKGDVEYLDILLNKRINDPRLYIQRSKALQIWTNLKRFKIWFTQKVGPTLSIVITVVSGIASGVIYVIDKLEDSKKKIDYLRDKVNRLLQEVEKEHKEQNVAIENVDKDTFKQTMSNLEKNSKEVVYHFIETFLNGSKKVITFVKNHIEYFTALILSLILYEVHDRPSPGKIHSMAKHKLREKLTL